MNSEIIEEKTTPENYSTDEYNNIIMYTRIRENIALAESAGSGMSIFEYDPQSNGATDYLALTEEILSRNL